MEPIQVVIVSAPGRKLENLQNLLESIDSSLTVVTVETCQDVLRVMLPERVAIILIDYRYPKKEMEGKIRDLFLRSANNHVVLLQNRNAPESRFAQDLISEVVYDDLSVGVLKNLLGITSTN